MNQDKRFQLLPFLALCLIFIGTPWLYAQNAKTNFQFTILKSTCEPQTEVLLKINGRSNEYRTDKEGVIVFDFDASSSYTYTASLYFLSDLQKSVLSFPLEKEKNIRTFYLDSPEDIAVFKQQNQTFSIEGFVKDEKDNPITGAIISIQGTGRKTVSDEIGLFQIEADYNHPIAIRAEGMENRLLNITPFLKETNDPYTVYMKEKSAGRVYSVVSQMPEFPRGGMKAFVNYLKRNLVYPPQALRDSIEGVVAVQFVVETNGEITSPVIVRHLEASMDTAALTAIRNMPRWIPGKENGRAVRCKYSVPVQFKIPRKAPEPKETPRPQKDTLNHTVLPQPPVLLQDSLKKDSLLHLQTDSILPPALLQKTANDSLIVTPADTLQKDSTQIQAPVEQPATQAPKKRNFLVRFFRWLFGIKDKEPVAPAENAATVPAEN